MGKVQGRQQTLPASLNRRVNLHCGHNGSSLASAIRMRAAPAPAVFPSADPFLHLAKPSLRRPCPNTVVPLSEDAIASQSSSAVQRASIHVSTHPEGEISWDAHSRRGVLPQATEAGRFKYI